MSDSNKSPDFRPNPDRAVFITGPIDQSSLDKLTPEIIRLLADSTEPLTVFIDSPGGSTFFAESIYRSLKLTDQDSSDSKRIITVALNLAASAACDLLIAGDYAVIQPHTIILCHGVRQSADGITVTRETATDLAKSLATSNEQYALQMASNAISRFIFRFAMVRSSFDSIRKETERPELSDSSCFLHAIQQHITPKLMSVLRQAMINHLDNELVDFDVIEKLNELKVKPANPQEFEAFLLKCVIDYQLKNSAEQPNWSFRNDGLPTLEEKFVVLVNSHEEEHQGQIEKLVNRWGEFLLSEQDSVEFVSIPQAEREAWLKDKVNRTIRSLWFLFVAICRLLQQNENYLSAEEAYWIGLVDEIVGRPDLPSPRLFVEYAFEPLKPESDAA